MTTDSERLERIERRLEALIATDTDLALVLGMNNTLLTEIKEELAKPASTDLFDLMKNLVTVIANQGAQIEALKAMIVSLGGRVGGIPEAVVRALETGEVA